MIKELFKDASKIFSGQAIGIGLSVVTTVAVARMLGPEGRGIYAFVMTLSAIFMQAALLGCDSTSRRIAGQDPKQVPELINYTLTLVLIGSTLSIAIAFMYGVTTEIGSAHTDILLLALCCLPFMAWNNALSSLLIGANRAGRSAGASLYPKVLLTLLFFLLIIGGYVTLNNVVIANLAATILGFALTFGMLWKIYKPKLAFSLSYFKGMWKYSTSAYVATLLYFLMYKITIIIVGNMLGAEAAGYYGIATGFTDLMTTPAAAVGLMLMVKLLNTEKSEEEKKTLHRKALLITAGLVSLGCITFAIISPWLIPLMFGEAFTPAVEPTQILCIAVLFHSLYLIEQNRILALGRARSLLLAPTLGCATTIGLSLYLIPQYGIAGAAWASVIAYGLAWCLTLIVIPIKKYHIS